MLVHLEFGAEAQDERLAELELLSASAGARVVGVVRGRRQKADPALFAGKGKVAEIAELISFLCSPRASFITGAYIVANGGFVIQ